MEQVFWLRPGCIAGRSGPNLHHWDIGAFKARGFSAILSVNDGELVHHSDMDKADIAYANIPMSANAPVRPGDKALCLTNLPRALAFVAAQLPRGPVLIHCRSGKDRTGLVLAAQLITTERLSVDRAIAEVLAVRPIAFSAEGWLDFAREVLTDFEQKDESR